MFKLIFLYATYVCGGFGILVNSQQQSRSMYSVKATLARGERSGAGVVRRDIAAIYNPISIFHRNRCL